jgi:sRNA-binding regulator protein Hfq
MATYKLHLNQDQIDFLSHLPEQGMGYQIVDIFLKNGKELKGKIVINCTYVKLVEDEIITADEIKTIELHRD